MEYQAKFKKDSKSSLNVLQKYLLFILGFHLSGCSMEADIRGVDLPSSGDLKFDVSHLDVKVAGWKFQKLSNGETEILINQREGIGDREVLFPFVPAEAELVCPGVEHIRLVQSIETRDQKKFKLKNWVPEKYQNQKFSCYYVIGGKRSQEIHFRLAVEAKDRYVASSSGQTSILQQIPEGGVVSPDGRYLLYLSGIDGHLYLKDLQTGEDDLISQSSSGQHGNGRFDFRKGAISANGRYVVFSSGSDNLVSNDTNGFNDIFVRDREDESTTRISLGVGGLESDADSYGASISSDGRYVAFESCSTNLVPDDSNDACDVFVHDRHNGLTERISISSEGIEANDGAYDVMISANGERVVFTSAADNLVPNDTNGCEDIFIRDRKAGTTIRVSVSSGNIQGNFASEGGSISADGRYVTFLSSATNFFLDDINGYYDLFVHDLNTGETTRVSKEGDFAYSSAVISGDGRHVLFSSHSSPDSLNLYVHNRESGVAVRLYQEAPGGWLDHLSISSNGQVATFSVLESLDGDSLTRVHDLQKAEFVDFYQTIDTAALEQSGGDYGMPGLTTISADGRYSVFSAIYNDLFDLGQEEYLRSVIFIRDRELDLIKPVSLTPDGGMPDDESIVPVISADGRYIAFYSNASNLIENQVGPGLFIYDQENDVTKEVGTEAFPYEISFSANGRYLSFSSWYVGADDNNHSADVFVYDLQSGLLERVSVSSTGDEADDSSYNPRISSDGRFVMFSSYATNLVAGDTNGGVDTFIHDRHLKTTTLFEAVPGASFVTASADGRYIVLEDGAYNYVYDRQNNSTKHFPSSLGRGSISRDGRYLAFGSSGLVVYDLKNNMIWQSSICKALSLANISDDGAYVSARASDVDGGYRLTLKADMNKATKVESTTLWCY